MGCENVKLFLREPLGCIYLSVNSIWSFYSGAESQIEFREIEKSNRDERRCRKVVLFWENLDS